MAVDYDLVVIGSSLEGTYAAATAAHLQARVALVTQNIGRNSYLSEVVFSHSLAQVANLVRVNRENFFGIYSQPLTSLQTELTGARDWSTVVNSNLTGDNSLTTLAALGVDVIQGKGEFCRLPEQAFLVGNRKLRARAYLVAAGTIEAKKPDDNFLTFADLDRQSDLNSLPHHLAIIGHSPHALMLAQSLTRLGKQVLLILEEKRLLPHEDNDASMIIQAQLEAEGVKILTSSPVTQCKNLGGKKWLQVGDRAIETEEIIFTGQREPNTRGLNLEGVGVNFLANGIQVNQKLQTSNSQIYACGDLIGGYSLPHIAQYEANIILKNALFIPWFKRDYSYLPWAILTQPNLARVGMTESQARQRYGENFYIVRQYFKSIASAQIKGNTTGLCKLLIRPNGQIVGAHIVGDNAAESIGAIALMMKSKIKLSKNAILGLLKLEFPYIYPSFAEIMQQTATTFHQQKLAQNKNLLNWLETWFDFRKR